MSPKINSNLLDIPEASSILINQIVYDKKKKGERVYIFSLGEAFFDIPRFDISDEQFQEGYHYSDSKGQIGLRKKIAEAYKKIYEVDVSAEHEILISAGSKPIIFMLLKCVIEEGEEVLISEPAWLSYKEQVKLAGGKYVGIPYYESIYEWEKYITDKTKIIIINNPNNPSGKLYQKEELEFLLSLAKKYGLFLLSDEAYSDFLLKDEKFFSLANIDERKEYSLIVNSLSKNMGISGWRIGYAIANKSVIQQLLKLNQHLLTCAATILQNYIADHFETILKETIPQARQMAVKRKKVQSILDKLEIKYLAGTGTFYFMLDVSEYIGTTEELVYKLLLDYNIATVPGEAYGNSTKDFIRFGIGVESLEDIEHCLQLLKKILKNSNTHQ